MQPGKQKVETYTFISVYIGMKLDNSFMEKYIKKSC